MFSAARTRLTTSAAARVLPAASGPKRALSSTSPLVTLLTNLVLLQLLMLCAEAHILPAEQHVLNAAAVTAESILAVRAEYDGRTSVHTASGRRLTHLSRLIKAEIIPTGNVHLYAWYACTLTGITMRSH